MTTTQPARPGFDPELLDALAQLPPVDITLDTVAAIRAAMLDQTPSMDDALAGSGLEHVDHVVPGPPDAPDIVVSVVRDPRQREAGPGIYYTHGGGMMFGHRRLGAGSFPSWIRAVGAVVVTVEYRLAPEHPFPAGSEDSYAGLLWTARNAADLGVDPQRLVIAGPSAGGGITASVALLARDRHGPQLAGQMLMSPMLDDRVDTVSARQFEQTPALWSGEQDRIGWSALLGEARGAADVSAYAAPAREPDLGGLPTTYLDVGSAEVFRDEAVAYASGIWAAGGQAELHVWPGAFHGWDTVAPKAEVTRRSAAARVEWLRRTVGVPHPRP